MSFTVNLASGQQFSATSDETLLAAAQRSGIELPFGCQSGSCGSCRGQLTKGQVTYPEGSHFPALGPWEKANQRILTCQARAASDLELTMSGIGQPVRTLPARVVSLVKLAPDVMQVKLRIPASESFEFRSGQYISLLLPGGRKRDFSLANTPDDDCLELHIRQVPHGQLTQQVFEQWRERMIVRFQGPFGEFFFRKESQRPVILVAGGTGLAPMQSLLLSSLLQRHQVPVYLYWGVRDQVDLYAHNQLLTWQERYDHFHYTPVLSAVSGQWSGSQGWVHEQVAKDFTDLSPFDIYLSGPPPMVQAALPVFSAQGMATDQVYYDAFEYAADTLQAMQNSQE